eukprot:15455196-Alexandrium_andersonii.AAC.1
MAGRGPSALLASQRSILAQAAPARFRRTGGPHQALSAAAEASGQQGAPFAPRSRPTAVGSHKGAQPQPRTAVSKAARSRRLAMVGGEAICAAYGARATTK